jgi:hypothetical protein
MHRLRVVQRFEFVGTVANRISMGISLTAIYLFSSLSPETSHVLIWIAGTLLPIGLVTKFVGRHLLGVPKYGSNNVLCVLTSQPKTLFQVALDMLGAEGIDPEQEPQGYEMVRAPRPNWLRSRLQELVSQGLASWVVINTTVACPDCGEYHGEPGFLLSGEGDKNKTDIIERRKSPQVFKPRRAPVRS